MLCRYAKLSIPSCWSTTWCRRSTTCAGRAINTIPCVADAIEVLLSERGDDGRWLTVCRGAARWARGRRTEVEPGRWSTLGAAARAAVGRGRVVRSAGTGSLGGPLKRAPPRRRAARYGPSRSARSGTVRQFDAERAEGSQVGDHGQAESTHQPSGLRFHAVRGSNGTPEEDRFNDRQAAARLEGRKPRMAYRWSGFASTRGASISSSSATTERSAGSRNAHQRPGLHHSRTFVSFHRDSARPRSVGTDERLGRRIVDHSASSSSSFAASLHRHLGVDVRP